MSGTPTVVRTVAALRAHLDEVRRGGASVGFVPTMGALHAGHASLMSTARDRHDEVVASIFVNPLQFGPAEDLDAYPRDLDGDLDIAGAAGVDVVFAPTVAEMYPVPVVTSVRVGGLTEVLDGAARPGHFDGVATVVTKLAAIVGPCTAYFGEKDFQQLAVVRRLALDLSLPMEVVGCPTVREPDGLAMSSRNAYLEPAERAVAPVVHRALLAGRAAVQAGCRRPDEVRRAMTDVLATEPLVGLDYAEVVGADSLTVSDPLEGELRLLVAVHLGRARLIDNLGCHAGTTAPPTQGATADAASTGGSR